MIGFLIAVACLVCAGIAVSVAVVQSKKNKQRKLNLAGKIALGVSAVFVLITLLISPSFHTVDTGEVAVVKRLGEAKAVRTAGTHFDFWVINSYSKYDAKVQNLDISTSAYSSDAQTMDVAMTLQYQILSDKAIEIAQEYGSLDVLQNRIQSIAVEKAKSVLSSYKAMDIISMRASMSPEVESAIKTAIADKYFVTISTVVLTNIDFSEAFEKAVEEKMIAEQKKLQAEYENEMKVAAAEAEAQAAIQKAEGEAKAKLIAAEAERDAQVELSRAEALSIQLKSVEIARALGFPVSERETVDEEGNPVIEYIIDFEGKTPEEIQLITDYLKYMEYLAKWDGKLPTVMSGDGASIMIPVEIE